MQIEKLNEIFNEYGQLLMKISKLNFSADYLSRKKNIFLITKIKSQFVELQKKLSQFEVDPESLNYKLMNDAITYRLTTLNESALFLNKNNQANMDRLVYASNRAAEIEKKIGETLRGEING